MGQKLLEVFVSGQGRGYVGSTITATSDGSPYQEAVELDYVELDYHDDRSIKYLSIFGPVEITRSYYHKMGHDGLCPLDEQLNLPERKYSYLLQKWLSAYCVKGTYDEAVAELKELLGISIPKRSMQSLMRDISQKVVDFWDQQPCSDGDAEILVISADGKGVPMKHLTVREVPKRLKKGQKRTKKKEAMVGTIYTVPDTLFQESGIGLEHARFAQSTRKSMPVYWVRSMCITISRNDQNSGDWEKRSKLVKQSSWQMETQPCGHKRKLTFLNWWAYWTSIMWMSIYGTLPTCFWQRVPRKQEHGLRKRKHS